MIMTRAYLSVLAIFCILAVPLSGYGKERQPDEGEQGFVTLFDGGNLDHWTMGPDRSWVVVDGEIHLQREFDGKEHNLDYLWTKEAYSDFVLELEFKIPLRANSGVFLRTSDLKDPVYTGIEIQVSNSYGRDQWSRGNCAGAVYDLMAPTANPVYEPGTWNRYRITCDGPRIMVELNGQKIIDMNVDDWTEPNRNPDGSKNKFPTPLKDFQRSGHIGLQDHGREVAFRNIRVKRLSMSTRDAATKRRQNPQHEPRS
jgi:hypothetical protein